MAFLQGEQLLRLTRQDGTQDQLSFALNEHAITLEDQGRYFQAEALYSQALEIDRATIGEAHPDYAAHLNNLAGVVSAQGRYTEAEAIYTQVLDIARSTIGGAHPD